jgi:hypothetical protein
LPADDWDEVEADVRLEVEVEDEEGEEEAAVDEEDEGAWDREEVVAAGGEVDDVNVAVPDDRVL